MILSFIDAIPGLAAGGVVLIKPSEVHTLAPQCEG